MPPGQCTHTVGEVHRSGADFQALLCRDLKQHSGHILRVHAFDDGNDGAPPAMRILVVYDCVKLVTERCLVYADTRPDVFGLQHPILGVRLLIPSGISAQRFLVGTLESVGIDHVGPAQALGRDWLTVHPPC